MVRSATSSVSTLRSRLTERLGRRSGWARTLAAASPVPAGPGRWVDAPAVAQKEEASGPSVSREGQSLGKGPPEADRLYTRCGCGRRPFGGARGSTK